jgi:hypothetical protein
MGRVWYEVRVREQIGPNSWSKVSKFFEATSPKRARSQYKGSGLIMWVSKVSKEKLLGIGEFFRLGDDLLRELRREEGAYGLVGASDTKDKRRGYYDRRREKASH